MQYDFQVKPEVLKIFDDTTTNQEIQEIKNIYKLFRITYNTEIDSSNPYSLLEIINGDNDNQQIILWGITDENKKVALAYWFVGDEAMEDEQEEYEKAIEIFEIIQVNYKIK